VLAARLGVAMSDDECARVEAYEKTKHPLLRLLLRHRPERICTASPGQLNLRARTPSSTFGYRSGYRREDMVHRVFARETAVLPQIEHPGCDYLDYFSRRHADDNTTLVCRGKHVGAWTVRATSSRSILFQEASPKRSCVLIAHLNVVRFDADDDIVRFVDDGMLFAVDASTSSTGL
jgi:hypothetical protein